MTCLVQVAPASKETPSNSPTTPTGRVDIATMFEGFVGLMAMASSASFPSRALTLRFVGIWMAPRAGIPKETSKARVRKNEELMVICSLRVRMTPPSSDGVAGKVRHPKRRPGVEQRASRHNWVSRQSEQENKHPPSPRGA